MAARWSPKPLVRVRVSGGVPKFRFAVICLIGYNYFLKRRRCSNGRTADCKSVASRGKWVRSPPSPPDLCDCGGTVYTADLKSAA